MVRTLVDLRRLVFGVAFMGGLAGSLAFAKGGLFKAGGKAYSLGDLSPALQQMLYDAEHGYYHQRERILEQALLETHISEIAAKKKKSAADVERELFEVKPASPEEAKAWFEENKMRLGGRTLDSVQGEIISHLTRQKQQQARTELVSRLKKEQKFELLFSRPDAPVVSIATQGFPTKGNAKAKIKIVEFADYGCPHCKQAAANLRQVVEQFKKSVHLTFVDFPLRVDGVPMRVAHGAHCAAQQDKFWEYHYQAFDRQSSLGDGSPLQLAKDLKLDLKKFETCLADSAVREKIMAGRKEGERIGINATPAIYINGRRFEGYSFSKLAAEVSKLLKSS